MLLRLFKGYQAYLLVLIPIVGIILWSNSFFIHSYELDGNYVFMPLSKLVYHIVGINTIASKLLAIALVLINALLLSRMNIVYNFIRARTYLPAVIYLLLMSFLPEIQRLTPALMASVFVILAMNKVLGTFKKEKLAIQIMDASLLISVASLFYFPAMFLLVYLWVGLALLRPFRGREWAFTILGLIVPYLIVLSFLYLTGRSFHFSIQKLFNAPFILSWAFRENILALIFWGYLVLLVLLASVQIITIFSTKKVHSRRFFIYFLWLFVITIGIYFIVPSASIEIFSLNAISLSFLLAHYFINLRYSWLPELLFVLLFTIILANKFF